MIHSYISVSDLDQRRSQCLLKKDDHFKIPYKGAMFFESGRHHGKTYEREKFYIEQFRPENSIESLNSFTFHHFLTTPLKMSGLTVSRFEVNW